MSAHEVETTRARILEPVRVVLDELAVEHRRILLRRLKDGFGDAAYQSHVAADADLHRMVPVWSCGRSPC